MNDFFRSETSYKERTGFFGQLNCVTLPVHLKTKSRNEVTRSPLL